jgi:hypothetical protein
MGKIITKSDEIESNIVLKNCKMESDQCKLWMYAYAVRYGAHLLDDMARALCYGPSPELRSEGVQITVSLLKANLEYVGRREEPLGAQNSGTCSASNRARFSKLDSQATSLKIRGEMGRGM